jgi:PUB domain/Ubiquitin family
MSSNTDSAATYSSNNATITIQLTITAAAGAPRVPLTLSSPTTAAELRRQVGSTTHIPLSSLRLIYRGRLINDSDQNDVVAEFKLEEGSVLHCMGKPEQAPAQTTASESTPAVIPSVTVVPAVASASATPPAASETSLDLPSALQQMRTANTPAVYLTGVTTLDKILSNIIAHPLEEKYRTLKIQNPAFQRRLGGITGGDRAIRACGFIVISTGAGESAYTMTASPEQWPALVQAKATLEQAVRQASSAATASSAPPLMASANAAAPPLGSAFPWGSTPGALPPMDGLRNTPEVQQMAAQLFSNPQQLQFMLQVRRSFCCG